jgi:D-alanyl-D-alanine carboxypeptidase
MMTSRLGQAVRYGLLLAIFVVAGAVAPRVSAAPYAAMVMDARSGEIFHADNADTRLHPASLTKMMTLYIAFQAVARGEISLDTEVRISDLAAGEPPSRLGLRAGQTIRLRYLLRAAAVKSANDAATAIGEALAGSESAFAARMNATAAAMGMDNTRFANMHGLTQDGHFSTAHDMTILGRHLIYDFPQYYNLFSRRVADAGVAEVANTNRRFLDAYPGADGIKTGFTNAAGYNLVASAERGTVRIIATVFGGTSTANRNARIAELLDLGFAEARANVAFRAPGEVAYYQNSSPSPSPEPANDNAAPSDAIAAARTVRVTGRVESSIRPVARPALTGDALVAAVSADVIESVLAEALQIAAPGAEPAAPQVSFAASTDAQPETLQALAEAQLDSAQTDSTAVTAPEPRPAEIIMTAADIAPDEAPPIASGEVVTRVSTSGGRHWAINLGSYNSASEAERLLLQAAIAEAGTLDGALRRVVQRSGGFEATFVGMTRDQADLACRRFQARGTTCFMMGTDE